MTGNAEIESFRQRCIQIAEGWSTCDMTLATQVAARNIVDEIRTLSPPLQTLSNTLRDALVEAKTWHQEMRKSCSKQPPSAMRDFAMATHAEQIENIDAALSASENRDV